MSSLVFFRRELSIKKQIPWGRESKHTTQLHTTPDNSSEFHQVENCLGSGVSGGKTEWRGTSLFFLIYSPTPICYMKSDVEFFTFLGSMLNFFRPMAICLFLCMLFLSKVELNLIFSDITISSYGFTQCICIQLLKNVFQLFRFSCSFFPNECTFIKTKAEWTLAAHTAAQRRLLRDTLPLFSQAQVFNLIGHLCYLILQPLRADRESEEEEEEHNKTESRKK